MKFLIVFVALFAIAFADVQILRQDSDVGVEDFRNSFETSDGTSVQAEGHLNNAGTDHESLAVKGSYTFTADDNVKYSISYVADENGFQPQGAHLPVA